MPNIIIRRNKIHDLILSCNKEKVYFLFQYGQMIDNSIDYDLLSNKFNQLTKG